MAGLLGRVRAALVALGRDAGQTVGTAPPAGQPPPAALTRGVAPSQIDAQTATFLGVVSASTSPAPDAGPLIETEEITATVGRCVSCVATDLASCRLILSDVTDREKPEEIDEHPALEVFRHINSVWQPNLFWQHVVADLLTEGNSFTWLDLRAGLPVNLLRMRPQEMHVVPHPQRIIGGYVLVDAMSKEHPYAVEEIMHIRTRNLSSPYRGLGEIARLRNAILLEREIANFNYYRFKNGLPVGLILKTNRAFANEEELGAFSNHIRRAFSGAENSGNPMIFQKGEFEVEQIARPSEEEIGFIKSLEWTRAEIAMMFGVPPVRLGSYNDAFRANGDLQERAYWEDTILGWQRLIAEYLNSVFLPRFWPNENLEFAFDTSKVRALQKSEKEIAEINEIGVRSGWLTPNEARERLNFEAFKDEAADQLYFNGRPIGEDPLAALAQLGAAGGAQPPQPGEKMKGNKGKEMPEDADMVPAKGRAMIRAIPTNLIQEQEETRRLADRVRLILREIYRVAAEEQALVSNAPGGAVVFDISDPAVIRFVETQAIRVSESVVHTTAEMIRKAIGEAIHAGTPVREMRDSIQQAFVERRADFQLDRIARTETHQAQNAGGWLGAKQMGVEFKRWTTSRDALVRGNDPKDTADHVTMEGQTTAMDAPFVDPRSGALLMYPGDGTARAGDVINCRCQWVSDFSHLNGWTPPDYDRAWIRKAGTAARFELAVRRFFERELRAIEARALEEYDRQIAKAAA